MKIYLAVIYTRMGLLDRKIAGVTVTPEDRDVTTINYRLSIGVADMMSQLKEWMNDTDNDVLFSLLKRLQEVTSSEEGLPVNDGYWHCLSTSHPFEYGINLYYKAEER